MRKITLVLLFCFCAVGFSQAQVGTESSGVTTKTDSKNNFRAILAPVNVNSKTTNVVQLTGKSSDLEKSVLGTTVNQVEVLGPQRNVSTHLVNYNATSSELIDGATSVSGQVNVTTGPYNGRSFNNPSGARVMPVLAYESGPYFSIAGPPDISLLENTALGMTTLGGGVQITAGNRIADDIILSDDYDVTSIDVFGYQTGAPTAPATINEINLQIWDGDPSDPASSVIWGDDVTNVLTSAIWSDAYRESETAPGTTRAIQRVTVETAGLSLAAGTYWVDYSMGGTATSGPWQPPVVILGQTMTGNAQQSIAGVWGPFQDGGTLTQLGAPVQVNGDCTSCGGALELPLTFEGQVVPFSDFNGSVTQAISNPDATGVNTSANVAENFVPAMAAFAGVNIVVPVDLTDDKMFSMNVWSPLAGTPVLLKLEGGPNPPVERLVSMTTSGAWEDVVFDFSSEGAIAFDSVTIFMNFNMTDPADQTFYWDNLVQLPGGGGGPVACDQGHTAAGSMTGSGVGSSLDSDFKTASDITVTAGEDFTVEAITASFLTFAPNDPPVSATITYYEDAAGLPGAVLGTETVVPTILSAMPWANPVADVYETSMAVTPFTFAGDAMSDTKYWIEIAMGTATNQGTVFWEATLDTPVVGDPAVQFSAVTGLWAIPVDANGDPNVTQEVIYNYSGQCEPIGTGGGMLCNQEHLESANPGGGVGSSVDSAFNAATDLLVAMGEDFTIDTIEATFLTFAPADPPTTANIVYYEDNAGLPGAIIGSETVVPTIVSAQPWVNPIADQYVTSMAVTPFTFAGNAASDTTYWIEITMGTATNQATVFWEYNRDGIEGNPVAQFDGAAWAYPDLDQDGNPDLDAEAIYNYAGECTPISVVALSFPITHESQVVPFVDFNGSATQQIANPDASGVNTSATVAENFVPANAAFAGVNFVIDVDLTNDKFFAMDVWSPLAGTPVLLKLEGGPNPPVERQVNLTTSGAWEEVIFDFSSEGAITFESVTIFMNFNMTDPADQTFYWDNLERLNTLPAPPNDLCENAIPMSCGEIVAGTTIDATEDGAVAPECDTTVTAPGVWYVYEDTTGLITDITITMCNGTTDYDSKLSVYTGECSALVCEVGNDDTCGLQSEVSFQSDGATTFYILVHGFGANTGNFEIEMNCTLVPPPNDMIANSIDVDEIGFPYTDPAVAMPAATVEAGSPVDCDNSGARGVWYNFVAAADGTATASITTPGGGLLFTVNNGPLAGSYPAVAADFGGAFTSTLITEDTAIVVDDDTTGDPNDACDPVLNGADLAGKIAIVRRGACEFGGKALAAQNEGAIAVIVVNNAPGDPIVMGGGVSGVDVTIPVLMITDVDGEAIIAELSGATVNASMGLAPAGFSAVTFYTAPDENAVETDLVLVDWFENQCLPGTSASIPTVGGQAYYVYVANHTAVTDIVIDGTNLGTEDNTIQGFSYYPNPASDRINLNAQDNIESVIIYNMLGQKVFEQNINATTSEINVSDLATGAYILQVSVNGQIGAYQILKK